MGARASIERIIRQRMLTRAQAVAQGIEKVLATSDDPAHTGEPSGGPTELDLMKYDQWAVDAVAIVNRQPEPARQAMLLHIFRVVGYHQATGETEALSRLSGDLVGTIELHQDERYVAASSASHADGPVGKPMTRREAVEALDANA